jgi:hypothetical protein
MFYIIIAYLYELSAIFDIFKTLLSYLYYVIMYKYIYLNSKNYD